MAENNFYRVTVINRNLETVKKYICDNWQDFRIGQSWELIAETEMSDHTMWIAHYIYSPMLSRDRYDTYIILTENNDDTDILAFGYGTSEFAERMQSYIDITNMQNQIGEKFRRKKLFGKWEKKKVKVK